MQYSCYYHSPLGGIRLACDEIGLTGLYFTQGTDEDLAQANLIPWYSAEKSTLFEPAGRWLDIYFAGREPDFLPPLHLKGTAFQLAVWKILLRIPYGSVLTYGQIAREIAMQRHLPKMSAQAVGGAVARNPVSIIVPCHRVIGANGQLTGYACGITRKAALLKLEKSKKIIFS